SLPAGKNNAAAIEGLDKRIAAAETVARTAAAAAETAARTSATDTANKLAALDNATRTATSETATRITALENTIRAARATADSAEADARKALAVPPPDFGPLTARIDAIEKRVTPLEAALVAPKTEVRAVEDREGTPAQQAVRAPSLAIAAGSLVRSV